MLITPSLGRSYWNNFPIVFVQFWIFDLVFVNWMCSVMHEFQGHNLQLFL